MFKKLSPLVVLGSLFAAQAAQAAPKITTVTAGSLTSAIKAQKGKVVVVNFWATWCAPCVAELPGLAQLQKQYGSKGVVVLLVSADDPGAGKQIAKTLTAKGQSKSYLIKGDMVEFFGKFDPKFKGAVALPRTYIYNRQGVKVKSVEADHTAAQYGQMLKPYL